MTAARASRSRKKKRAAPRSRKGRVHRVRPVREGSREEHRRTVLREFGVELALDTYAIVAGAVERGLESGLNAQSERIAEAHRLDVFAALRKSVLVELDRVVRFRPSPEDLTPRVNVRAADLVSAVLEAFRGFRMVREDPKGEKGPPWHM